VRLLPLASGTCAASGCFLSFLLIFFVLLTSSASPRCEKKKREKQGEAKKQRAGHVWEAGRMMVLPSSGLLCSRLRICWVSLHRFFFDWSCLSDNDAFLRVNTCGQSGGADHSAQSQWVGVEQGRV